VPPAAAPRFPRSRPPTARSGTISSKPNSSLPRRATTSAFAHGVGEPPSDLDQQAVGLVVAEQTVDALEVIDIDVHDGDSACSRRERVSSAAPVALGDKADHGCAARSARRWWSRPPQLRFQLVLPRRVFTDREKKLICPSWSSIGEMVFLSVYIAAVLALVDELAGPHWYRCIERRPHVPVTSRRRQPRAEHLRRAANHSSAA
jgi:hypothetical protein